MNPAPAAPPNSRWKDVTSDDLKALRRASHTASGIAAIYGVTRSAVLGKLHRLGLAGIHTEKTAAAALSAAKTPQAKSPAAKAPKPARPSKAKAAPAASAPAAKPDGTGLAAKLPARGRGGRPQCPPPWAEAVPAAAPVAIVAPIAVEAVPEPPVAGQPVTFDELQSHHCRWPFGDPKDHANFRFCGQRRISESRPYCAAHSARASGKPEAADGEERGL